MQSIPALVQFEHGDLLLHRTFLRRQVTQLRELELGGSSPTWRGKVAVKFVGRVLSLAGKRFGSSGEAEWNDIALS